LPFFLLYAPIKAVLLAKNYDVILLGSALLGNTAWLVKKLTSKPVCMVTHGLDLTWKNEFYQKLWVGKFIPSSDRLIAVGNETIRAGVQRGLPQDKFVFIPNGVDTERYLGNYSRKMLEDFLKRDLTDKHVLLTSGRLAKRKGVAWFVENVMTKLNENIIYVIAGAGVDYDAIKNAIEKHGLGKRVLMLGYISDPDRNLLFNTCDLFIQPNIKIEGDIEGFGISVIEAGACKLPVIASRLEGLQDAIADGKNGFLIESGDAQGYINKITELLSDTEQLKVTGDAVRKFVVDTYDWKIISRRYIEEISKTIK
jgi:phosphatidylinositol alpha-1,6-mannosyltransferase